MSASDRRERARRPGTADAPPPASLLPAARDLCLFIVAGEHSGDALGGRLMAALNRLCKRPRALSRRGRRGHGARKGSPRSFRCPTSP